ncbi:MAG: PPOX class F420-dependent oxidoreductase [Actinomycetota bacterium]|nr:PPOX class F420-dependent oxidoreductase [Actinomycetota bacterium]
MIPESHADLLDKRGFAHLASLGRDGEPQSHPVWYSWENDELLISTTKQRQKYENIQRDARVAASILDPDNPYRYLEIRGRVTEVEDDPQKQFVDRLARKYLDKDEYPHKQPQADRVVIHIQPQQANTMG